MPTIRIIDNTGKPHILVGETGQTVMEIAIGNMVPGVVAECSGACACGTCHVYVDEAWREKAGKAHFMEEDLLEYAVDVRANSRLACQITLTDEMDGLTVTVAERQHHIEWGTDAKN